VKDIGVTQTIKKHLISSIEDQSIPEPNSGCWLWLGSTGHSGYGRIGLAGGNHNAHRISYFCFVDDPGELYVLHKCDNRLCVNPQHLFKGSASENTRDMYSKGRGYKLTGENNPRAILSVKDVLEIRESGEKTYKLADKFGVSKQTISAIRARRNWKHVA
jgi:HNH endonuclease